MRKNDKILGIFISKILIYTACTHIDLVLREWLHELTFFSSPPCPIEAFGPNGSLCDWN